MITTDRVGIEIELEGVSSGEYQQLGNAVNRYWDVKEDGSLRNGGIEIVSRGGQGGSTLISALDVLERALSTVDFNASWRCSTHIHVNMLDATMKQCAMFVMAYTCVEPVMFHFCGDSRQANNFCIQNKDCLSAIKTAMYIFHTMQAGGPGCTIEKYMALNVLPLFHPEFGTVEFRGSHAITEKDELIALTNRMLAIKRLVMQWTGDEESLINHIELNGWRHVFQGVIPEGMECCTNDQFEAAVMRAWSLLKSYLGWDKKLKEKKTQEDAFLQSIRAADQARRTSPQSLTQMMNSYSSWAESPARTREIVIDDQAENPTSSSEELRCRGYVTHLNTQIRRNLVDAIAMVLQQPRSSVTSLPRQERMLAQISPGFADRRYGDIYKVLFSVPAYMHYMDNRDLAWHNVLDMEMAAFDSEIHMRKIRILNGAPGESIGRVRLSHPTLPGSIRASITSWLQHVGIPRPKATRASLAFFWGVSISMGARVSFKNRNLLKSICLEYGYHEECRNLSYLSAFWMFKKYNLFDQTERFVMSQHRQNFDLFCHILNTLMNVGFAVPHYEAGNLMFKTVAFLGETYRYNARDLNGTSIEVNHTITTGTN